MFGNNIYNTAHGFGTIKYRIRSFDHFDLLYRIDRYTLCRAVIHHIDRRTIDENQCPFIHPTNIETAL